MVTPEEVSGRTGVSRVLYCPALNITLQTGALHSTTNLVALGARFLATEPQALDTPNVITTTAEHPIIKVLNRNGADTSAARVSVTAELTKLVAERFGPTSGLIDRSAGNLCWGFPPDVIATLMGAETIDELVKCMEDYLETGLERQSCNAGVEALARLTIGSAIVEINFLKSIVEQNVGFSTNHKARENDERELRRQVFPVDSEKSEIIDLMKVVSRLLKSYAEQLISTQRVAAIESDPRRQQAEFRVLSGTPIPSNRRNV